MQSDEARHWNSLAGELSEEGRHDEAEAAYLKASALAPQWSAPLYNLGLMHKYLGNWERSLWANLQAAERESGDQATWWNTGIAATALEDWKTARKAWHQAGVELRPGDHEPNEDFGLVPIRLNPDSSGEVIWARRIDPARAVIQNIPFEDAGFHWNDVILHDGAPSGYRKLEGRDVPVFDCLALLRRSGFQTFSLELTDCHYSFDTLSRAANRSGGYAEDWSATTRILCRACSEGNPDISAHNHSPADTRVGIAARDKEHLREILDRCRAN